MRLTQPALQQSVARVGTEFGLARVGVVAIGRNEGERLRRCLESLDPAARPTVYVDSGSTDGSPDLARSLGADVVALDLATPFTAARARNAGFDRLLAIAPDVEYVQFVDGDCEVDPAWIPTAAAALDARPEVAVVCGRRRERFPGTTVYNRLCDLEWDGPPGEADACGGDALDAHVGPQGRRRVPAGPDCRGGAGVVRPAAGGRRARRPPGGRNDPP